MIIIAMELFMKDGSPKTEKISISKPQANVFKYEYE